mmetsp:Transcript_6420/g.18103  ORF Transcript_6420/g.18103 Transcript_6420/m.18103 type:complete len:291 (-) Transcript_6420:183-1055(-)
MARWMSLSTLSCARMRATPPSSVRTAGLDWSSATPSTRPLRRTSRFCCGVRSSAPSARSSSAAPRQQNSARGSYSLSPGGPAAPAFGFLPAALSLFCLALKSCLHLKGLSSSSSKRQGRPNPKLSLRAMGAFALPARFGLISTIHTSRVRSTSSATLASGYDVVRERFCPPGAAAVALGSPSAAPPAGAGASPPTAVAPALGSRLGSVSALGWAASTPRSAQARCPSTSRCDSLWMRSLKRTSTSWCERLKMDWTAPPRSTARPRISPLLQSGYMQPNTRSFRLRRSSSS